MLTNKKYKICEEYEMLVNDQLEGIISINDEAELELHLADCQDCRDYKIETVKLLNKINGLPKEIKPRNYLWNKIEQQIIGETSENVYSMNTPPQTNAEQSHQPFKWKYMLSGIAAVIALFAIIFLFAKYAGKNGTDTIDNNSLIMNVGSFWKVNTLNGSADIDGKQIAKIDSLAVGQTITTNDTSRVELVVVKIGRVIIEPKSKVQLVKSVDGEYRIKVIYGTIDANIAAAPRTFFVDMPSVTAVDMGCSYKLSVDPSGDGLLFVKQGKVSLESDSRESMVTAGKFCITKKDVGPGTPFRGDTSPKLKRALIDFDFGNCAGNCVNVILKNSTRNDAVTLLNILPRVDEEYKKVIYARVAGFGDAPRVIPDDSLKYLDMEKLDEWMDKCQEDFEKHMEKSIEKNLQKMEFHLQKIPFSPEDEKHWEEYGKKWEEWGKEFGKEWEKWGEQYGKDIEKKFKMYEVPEDGHLYKFEYDGDTVYQMPLDKEELKRDIEERKRDMEELKRDMLEMQKEMKKEFDNDGLKREMEKMKEELKRSQEELKESMKELKKNLKNNIKVEIDSSGNYYKYKIETKDNNGEINTEENEIPKILENKEDKEDEKK